MNSNQMIDEKANQNNQWNERISRALDQAVKKEIAKLRRLKLPIIVSINGRPVDINPDTNPEAPPWKD